MSQSSEQFAQLLSQAVRQVALRQKTKIQAVQDELGYALGREAGGSTIEYWRKGYIPAKLHDIEMLARALFQRGGFPDTAALDQFLRQAGHPAPERFSQQLIARQPSPQASTHHQPRPALDEHPAFIVGPPVSHPRHFFGRERELKRLFGLLKHRPLQNAAIIGPRRSGKSSLLNYLRSITTTPADQLRPHQRHDWLALPQAYQWIMVDFQDARLGRRERLLAYLLDQLNLPVPDPCDLESFLDTVSGQLHHPTIILLDEIGVALARYPELDDAFWEGLRALATNQVGGNLAFVLAAQEAPDQLAAHSDLGSPFFNIFGYTAQLGPLRQPEAAELLSSTPLALSPTESAWIIERSGGWPILLQILCRERWLAAEDGEEEIDWQAEALRQMAPFRYLLDGAPGE
ncbi:MAG: ATP-binding protein [Anaerolineae bacterium]|nr:ATP-binding protein [Anaerolineae bacterium]